MKNKKEKIPPQTEYKLTYHVEDDLMEAVRYVMADTDEHAVMDFLDMFEKGHRCRGWDRVEKWNRFSEEWEALDLSSYDNIPRCDDET
tara:strand:+ start:657 stop:920 length:264 start_codon:yes stop_codon:yes gene_type:complete